MKRVLLVKTSSLGDVVHTLPAVTDAWQELAGEVQFDWVLEESYVPLVKHHQAVAGIIPVAMRRWRRRPFSPGNWFELRDFLRQLSQKTYDLVIDAQGLLKSALIARWSGSPVVGLDRNSAREPLASRLYCKKLEVPRDLHAVQFTRRLFAGALDYTLPETPPDYGVPEQKEQKSTASNPGPRKLRLMLIHGASWSSKLWPESHWRQLAGIMAGEQHQVLIPWGDAAEEARARRIAESIGGASVLPRLGLGDLMAELAGVDGAVCMDTGLGHLLAALNVPTVSLYGPTTPNLTGTRGRDQEHLVADASCSPCLKRSCRYARAPGYHSPCLTDMKPEAAWEQLQQLMERRALGSV